MSIPNINLVNITKKAYEGYFIFRWSKRNIISDLSLDIPSGSKILLEGKNGSGKSTLLSIISGINKPESGKVLIDGKNLYNDIRLLHYYRRYMCGLVTQSPSMIDTLSIIENIKMPLLFHNKLSNINIDKQISYLIEILGLKEFIHRSINKLSPGQIQRVGIARTFISDPKIILADEAYKSIDAESRKVYFNLLSSEIEKGKTIIIVTHDDLWKKYLPWNIFSTIKINDGIIENNNSNEIVDSEIVELINQMKLLKNEINEIMGINYENKLLLDKYNKSIPSLIKKVKIKTRELYLSINSPEGKNKFINDMDVIDKLMNELISIHKKIKGGSR
ncbi:ATP-binding cassette domain-containing protein [Herpetosiphon geysericola]|uniref:ATP-binding cassette domain-containing protein n=1 Tax=Herpetosiphon geysericola TaxID=70996 RepID=UPI0006C9059E|nr:ATP-binding cassette domain-containing protein [Herpetosiphon geysericola]